MKKRKLWAALALAPLLLAGQEIEHNYAPGSPAPGSIKFRWIFGSICAARNRDPRIQVVMYNEDTYILRENPAIDYRAPFTYLLMGNKRALLIDSGATSEAEYYPLRKTVDAVLQRWSDIRGKSRVPLTVVLTSPEYLAQNQGYGQFAGRPDTTLMPLEAAKRKAFFESGPIDLGGRVITVIPTPGTHRDGVSFYDPYDAILMTGDFLFPGRIMIANDADYLASVERLHAFATAHPVKWVMGGHVDINVLPGVEYLRLANYRPDEHVLQLEPALINDALNTATKILGKAAVAIRPEYVMRNRVGPDERLAERPADLPPIPVVPRLR